MSSLEIVAEDFHKGLRLLHSRSPDSSDELKKLLDCYYLKKINNQDSKRTISAFSPIQTLRGQADDTAYKKSKNLEADDSEATDIEDNETLDGSENSNSVNNCCANCKQTESPTGNTKVFECQECHLCYHPECHKPPVPKKDLNDPRSIWYCFKCKSTGKRLGKLSANKLVMGKTSAATIYSTNINKLATNKTIESTGLKRPATNKVGTQITSSSSSPQASSFGLLKTSTTIGGQRSSNTTNSGASVVVNSMMKTGSAKQSIGTTNTTNTMSYLHLGSSSTFSTTTPSTTTSSNFNHQTVANNNKKMRLKFS